MRKHTVIGVLALLAVAIACFMIWLLRDREPVYQDRPLYAWLEDLDFRRPTETRERAANAVRQMGTNAIPTLLKMLRAEDSSLKRSLMRHVEWQVLVRHGFTFARQRRDKALNGFRALGPLAKAAVPFLVEATSDSNLDIRLGAGEALRYIQTEVPAGPDAG